MKKKRGRGLPVTASDRGIAKSLSDKELSFMIRNTSGAAKKLFLKEAGRRVAEEMKSGARRNPPIYTGSKRKVHNGAEIMIGISVYEIRYRHAADGKDYKHPFETDDVMLLGMPDGSLKVESATGKKLWQNFDV